MILGQPSRRLVAVSAPVPPRFLDQQPDLSCKRARYQGSSALGVHQRVAHLAFWRQSLSARADPSDFSYALGIFTVGVSPVSVALIVERFTFLDGGVSFEPGVLVPKQTTAGPASAIDQFCVLRSNSLTTVAFALPVRRACGFFDHQQPAETVTCDVLLFGVAALISLNRTCRPAAAARLRRAASQPTNRHGFFATTVASAEPLSASHIFHDVDHANLFTREILES